MINCLFLTFNIPQTTIIIKLRLQCSHLLDQHVETTQYQMTLEVSQFYWSPGKKKNMYPFYKMRLLFAMWR